MEELFGHHIQEVKTIDGRELAKGKHCHRNTKVRICYGYLYAAEERNLLWRSKNYLTGECWSL